MNRFDIVHKDGEEMCIVVFRTGIAIGCEDGKTMPVELKVCVRYEDTLEEDIEARYSDWLWLAFRAMIEDADMKTAEPPHLPQTHDEKYNIVSERNVKTMADNKRYIITKEIIQAANDYMPIDLKESLARDIADSVLSEAPTDRQNIPSLGVLSLPCLKEENPKKKSVFLLFFFLKFYLKAEVDEKNFDYDYYASGNVFNQMERLKAEYDIKNKVFDIIADFKEFKKFVDTEIYNRRTNANDGMGRLFSAMQQYTSPENISRAAEEMKKLIDGRTAELQTNRQEAGGSEEPAAEVKNG